MSSSLSPEPSKLIAGTEVVSTPGATLEVTRIKLTPEGRRALAVGAVLPNGDVALGIPADARPFGCGEDVLDYYDGPLLMVLRSPLQGDLLAMALLDEEGPWPFLLAPISAEQLDAVKEGTRQMSTHIEPPGRGVREHFQAAERVFILRDYGAANLVAQPVEHPLPEDWLPQPGY